DHVGFDANAARDDFAQDVEVERQQLLGIALEPLEQGGIEDHAGLDDFGKAGAKLARGKAAKRQRVDEHGRRLPEAADEILSLGAVHSGLAADARIDLREK